MKISGVAIGQWNGNCRKQEGNSRTQYKILRAIVMGKVTHIYSNGGYIVRYYDINVLVSSEGLVLTLWKDSNTPQHTIDPKIRHEYDRVTSVKENIRRANGKHYRLQSNIKGKSKKVISTS